MVVAHDLTPVKHQPPPAFNNIFICPLCGTIGIVGETGFAVTERASWFRCESCDYVFGIQLAALAKPGRCSDES